MKKKSIMCVVGTRPEAIKVAPLVRQLKKTDWAEPFVLSTAQHRDILDQEMAFLGLSSDLDLNIMQVNQTLPQLTARLMVSLDDTLKARPADVVVAIGDTSTTMVSALTAFYHKIPFAHVEAGVRTHNMYNPFPEEMNRLLCSSMATFHFAPTELNKKNLVTEGIDASSIYVTGNTVIDVLMEVAAQKTELNLNLDLSKKIILVTSHRRESFGEPFANICRGIKKLADRVDNIQIVYPVHPNPHVSEVAHQILGNHPRISLIKPLDYGQLVAVMKKSHFIITDSGGIQEEAPSLGKPLLVVRDNTDRPEGVLAGVAKVIGTNTEAIFEEALKLLRDEQHYALMSQQKFPYGDGHAAQRIVNIFENYFEQKQLLRAA